MSLRAQACGDCGAMCDADDLYAVRPNEAVCPRCWRARVAAGGDVRRPPPSERSRGSSAAPPPLAPVPGNILMPPPLCIDCGRNPQPPRHDGEPGTHHRCDPCARIYLRRRSLRHRLCTGPWGFAAQPDAVTCSECDAAVPPGACFYRLGGMHGAAVCSECVRASGWAAEIERAGSTPPLLQSADLTRHAFDGSMFVAVTIPIAMPVLAVAAFDFLRRLAGHGGQGAISASRAGMELSITVSGGDDDEAIDLLGACACWLTRYAACVTCPPALYRALRSTVYDNGGIQCARRLKRQSVS